MRQALSFAGPRVEEAAAALDLGLVEDAERVVLVQDVPQADEVVAAVLLLVD